MANHGSRHSVLEKQKFLEEWKLSGKNKAAFCKEQQISYHSFNHWVKQAQKKESKGKPAFVPLVVKPTSSNSLFSQIILKNGATVNIYQPVDSSFLRDILKA